MKKIDIGRAIEWICIGVILVLSSLIIIDRPGMPWNSGEKLAADTVIVVRTDTITAEKPVYVSKETVRTELVPVHDTLRIHDTLYIQLPVEQLEYRDSLYQAWVSGIRPALDSIRIFAPVQTVTITQRTKPPNWGIGITAGYGVTVVDKNVRLAPYVGIGISYNIIHW